MKGTTGIKTKGEENKRKRGETMRREILLQLCLNGSDKIPYMSKGKKGKNKNKKQEMK